MIESVRTRQVLFFGIVALIFRLGAHVIQLIVMQDETKVFIKNGDSVGTIHTFGATFTSWKVDNEEMLFLSKQSMFDNKKAIRGGVPVIFPQFGPWEYGPQHGFARITRWSVKPRNRADSNTVTLVLEDTEQTRAYWDYNFRIEYTLTLITPKELKMDVVITNTGSITFGFTFLLHTYFRVPNVLLCAVSGLKGSTYIDKVKQNEEFKEDRDVVTLTEFTDRVYKNTTITHTITNLTGNRVGQIEKFNLPDTVIWNPWSEIASTMSDFGNDEWKNMICVEAGYVSTPSSLIPGKSFVASQLIKIL